LGDGEHPFDPRVFVQHGCGRGSGGGGLGERRWATVRGWVKLKGPLSCFRLWVTCIATKRETKLPGVTRPICMMRIPRPGLDYFSCVHLTKQTVALCARRWKRLNGETAKGPPGKDARGRIISAIITEGRLSGQVVNHTCSWFGFHVFFVDAGQWGARVGHNVE